mgnify:CR=1 FL=1
MVNEGEAILLILATGVLIWLLMSRRAIVKVPHSRILQLAYYILYISFSCTVFESLFLFHLLNTLEHICYALSMLLVTMWCYKMFGGKKNQ